MIKLPRREFLKLIFSSLATSILAACGVKPESLLLTPEITPTVTLEKPTSTPVTFEPPVVPFVSEGDLLTPAIIPPEYKPMGGEIVGLTPEELKKHELTQWFRLFKKEQDIEGQAYYFTGANMEEAQKNFEAAMAEVAESHPDIEMHQLQSFDRKSLLTYLTRVTPQADGTTGYTVFWGFNPTGSMAFAEPNLTNDLTRLGEVSVPAGLRPEFNYNEADGHWYMFGVDQDGNATQWFNTFRATQASLDQHWTEIAPIIPELPEWATEYTAHHGGIYEKDGDKQYYACDKQITVGEEVRNIRVRLVEYDDKAKEWIPCYETIQNLLDTDKYGSLLTLNTITTPADAVWMIRKGGVQEVSDLQRLEVILNAFATRIEATYKPEDSSWVKSTLPTGKLVEFGEEILLVKPPTDLIRFDVESWNRHGEGKNVTPILVDGIDILNPHAWVTARRGNLDQLVCGILSMPLGVTWVGFDESVINEVRKQYPIDSIEQSILELGATVQQSWRAVFTAVKKTDASFGEDYLLEQLESWKDVREYYDSLPLDQKNYVQESLDLFEAGKPEEANQKLSGKIMWRMLGGVDAN